MKKFYTPAVAVALIAGSASAQQLPNSDFEGSWVDCVPWNTANTTDKQGTVPENWCISNVVTPKMSAGNATVGGMSTGNESNSAVRVFNKSTAGQVIPGYLTLGTTWSTAKIKFATPSDEDGGTWGGLNGFNYRPDAVSFDFKHSNGSGSTQPASAVVYLWKGKTEQLEVPGANSYSLNPFGSPSDPKTCTMVNRDRNILGLETIKGGAVTKSSDFEKIAATTYSIAETTTEWKSLTFPIEYFSNATPENINVIFSACDYFADRKNHKGDDELTVDNVRLIYYSRLASLKINGTDIEGFSSDKFDYAIDEEMPAAEAIEALCLGNSGSATANVEVNATDNTITITVTNSNQGGLDIDGEASHVYTLTFKKAETPTPPEPQGLTYRRKYTDSSSRYYTEISYTVNDNNTVVYSTSDPSQEPYYVTPVNGSWQTEGAYIDMTDKVIEVPVNAESFTMILKSTFGATHWSQNAIFVDWNNNGSFVDAGETNGVINISNKPNTAEGGLVAKGGETDEIALPEGLKAGDTFTLLIAMNEPKGVDGTQDLWGTDWEWTTEIFNGDVCSLINGQAYALTVKITEKSAPTVVSTKDYVGRLTVQIGEDGEATEVENTTIHFSTMSDGTYSLLLEKFGADPSDPTSNGLGDIQVDGITRDGDNLSGFAPMLELMDGMIKANATLTGEFEGEDITLHLDVNWLGEDGVTVLAPIYVDFTTKPKEVTVVSTKDYTGTLAIQIGEDSEATDRENTTIHFSTMSDGTYSLLLEKFGADPSDPTSNGLGDIQIDGITRNGNNLNGFAPMLELMNGTIKANATLTGEFEGEDLTIHLDVNWLDEDGVTVLAPIYVDFTTIKNPSAIDSIDADNNAPVEYYTIQGVRVSGDNLTPGIYIRRQGNNVSKILVK